jgi:nucleotide-binding universal stress UspA family protein
VHILIGTDGSDDAVHAARRGVAMLAPASTITVLCAVDTLMAETAGMESGFGGGIATPQQLDSEREAVIARAREVLSRTIAAIDSPATIEQHVVEGDAGWALCKVAADVAADVIVVGSRGQGAIKRALLGSVSTHVVHQAPCAVLVVRVGTA